MSSVYPRLRFAPPDNRTYDFFVSIDPGPHTGFATYHPLPGDPGLNFDLHTEDFGKEGHASLDELLHQFQVMFWTLRNKIPDEHEPRLVMIIEKFEYRKDDAAKRDRIDFTAAEYVGVCKLFGYLHFDEVIMQGASEAKPFWTDDKLRALGLYGDTKHSRDVLRHLLKHMAFRKHDPQKWLFDNLRKAEIVVP